MLYVTKLPEHTHKEAVSANFDYLRAAFVNQQAKQIQNPTPDLPKGMHWCFNRKNKGQVLRINYQDANGKKHQKYVRPESDSPEDLEEAIASGNSFLGRIHD